MEAFFEASLETNKRENCNLDDAEGLKVSYGLRRSRKPRSMPVFFFFFGGGGGLVRKLYDPFLWMRFDYPKAAERLRGDSLHFTINSPGIPSTYLIELVMMKG